MLSRTKAIMKTHFCYEFFTHTLYYNGITILCPQHMIPLHPIKRGGEGRRGRDGDVNLSRSGSFDTGYRGFG